MKIQKRVAFICLLSPFVICSVSAAADRFGVTVVPGAALRGQIEKAPAQAEGSAWIDYVRKSDHSVLVVHRNKSGRAEVHTGLTDIWYVIDGGGTLVTGGTLRDGKKTAPGELRGSAVSGGIARHIGRGDIIDIPAGVPHWVSRIDGKELVYLTVKVATPPH